MAIKSVKELGKLQIDLTGPDGNAFFLLATASNLCRQLCRDFKPIEAKMKSGNYENLVQVFDAEFDDYVDLYR